VEKDVPVDVETKDGTTPIALACFGGHLDAMEVLTELGADLMHCNSFFCSLAHWATMGGHVTVCQKLIGAGLAFDVAQKEGQTPLHKAAFKGHAACVRLLCEHLQPSTLAMQDTSGYTAEQLASMAGHTDLATFLRDRIAKPAS
jgi:ankyrin repeat protein